MALSALACAFFPYRAYLTCGTSQPAALPETVRVGLYDEFPTPERLDRLSLLDVPIGLAGLHYDPDEYPQVWLHLDLFSAAGLNPDYLKAAHDSLSVEGP